MANKALYKEMLPLRRNEMGRAEQAQLEIETDKSSGNLKSGAMVYWLGEDGLKSHAYSIIDILPALKDRDSNARGVTPLLAPTIRTGVFLLH